jgi:hypothetical protein
MTRLRGSWVAVAAVALFLLSACARTGDPGAAPSESAAPGGSPSADSDALVLRIDRVGGFVAPDQQVGRYPVVSVYADGQVITTGPQIQIYPGPALPNLLVQQVDEATLQGLLDKAVQAGVRSGADLGRPSVADAPTTRITVATPGSGSSSLEAVALTEAQPDDPRLTPAQREARAKLATFVQEVSDLPTAEGMPKAQPYRPVAVAALARP